MASVDPVEELMTLVSSNWDSANTDGKTPVFKKIYDKKRVSLRFDATNGYISFYDTFNDIRQSGQGGADNQSHRHVSKLKIDIRTQVSEANSLKLLYEVYRILSANKATGTPSFPKIIPKYDYTPLNDKNRNVWRYVVAVDLKTERRNFQ